MTPPDDRHFEALMKVASEVEPPPGLENKVMLALERERRHVSSPLRFHSFPLKTVAAVLLIFAAAGGGYRLGQRESSPLPNVVSFPEHSSEVASLSQPGHFPQEPPSNIPGNLPPVTFQPISPIEQEQLLEQELASLWQSFDENEQDTAAMEAASDWIQ